LEDGNAKNNAGEFATRFSMRFMERKGVCTQSLIISGGGDDTVVPEKRRIAVRFKNIPSADICVYINGKKQKAEKLYLDYAAVSIEFQPNTKYKIVVRYPKQTNLEKQISRACRILTEAEGENPLKMQVWRDILQAKTRDEYFSIVEKADLSEIAKLRLKEML
jgi:hypothetical protein